jgi:hypothetical protein
VANYGNPPTFYDGAVLVLQSADTPVPVPSGQPRPGGFWIKGASYAYQADSFRLGGVGVPAVHIDIAPAVAAVLSGAGGGDPLSAVAATPNTLLKRDGAGSGKLVALEAQSVQPPSGQDLALNGSGGTTQATATNDGFQVGTLGTPPTSPMSVVDRDLDEMIQLDSGGMVVRVKDARWLEVRVGTDVVLRAKSVGEAAQPVEFPFGAKVAGVLAFSGDFKVLDETLNTRLEADATTTRIVAPPVSGGLAQLVDRDGFARVEVSRERTRILDQSGGVLLDDGVPEDIAWTPGGSPTSITPDYSTNRMHIRITSDMGTFKLENPVNAVDGAEYRVTLLGSAAGGDNLWGDSWVGGNPWGDLATIGLLNGDPLQQKCFTFRYVRGKMRLIAFHDSTDT